MKRVIWIGIALVAVLGLAAGVNYWWQLQRVEVTVVPVTRSDFIVEVTASGLITMGNLDEINPFGADVEFTADVDEADIAEVAVDQTAKITLNSYPDIELTGRISTIAPTATPTLTGSIVFPVVITLDELDDELTEDISLRIGMQGEVVISIGTEHDVLITEIDALFTEGGHDYVYVVQGADGTGPFASDTLAKREVTVGRRSDTLVELIGGVTEGEELALATKTPFTDNLRVR
ncbi:MAG: HlyD family efflux transporter periplasmic adaptor subunit [Coriobacteriia bacterium]|nr:HlyD family efflux transporter periplasmic adaptor subunit [Coriobacteriia bacterium]